jgi:hypothetical protein
VGKQDCVYAVKRFLQTQSSYSRGGFYRLQRILHGSDLKVHFRLPRREKRASQIVLMPVWYYYFVILKVSYENNYQPGTDQHLPGQP